MFVHFSTKHSSFPFFRQTPNGDGIWKSHRYVTQDARNEAEWLIVYDEPAPKLSTTLPLQRRIVFIGEPPENKTYPAQYLNQFGFVVSPVTQSGYKGKLVRSQSALPWFFGVDRSQGNSNSGRKLDRNWNQIQAAFEQPKTKLVSVVCSNKSTLAGHRERLALVRALKSELGDTLDVFGRGFNDIADKADAIAPYKYHIALENNRHLHFWTEKLADAFLGRSLPIHAGCPNLDAYFPPQSYVSIDSREFERSIAIVKRTIESNMWEESQQQLAIARDRILHQYNLFAVCEGLLSRAAGPVSMEKDITPINDTSYFRNSAGTGKSSNVSARSRLYKLIPFTARQLLGDRLATAIRKKLH